jgi:hypothetical protein
VSSIQDIFGDNETSLVGYGKKAKKRSTISSSLGVLAFNPSHFTVPAFQNGKFCQLR